MDTRYPNLFRPIKIGNLILKNRITNAPIYNFLASYDNHITRECIEFSKPFGKGGAATVTMGSGFINRVLPAAAHHIVGMGNDWMGVYLSEWCEAVKRYGAKACVELVPIATYFGTHEVESSVGIPMEIDCNLLTEKELEDFIEDYAKAARTVLNADGDMVLIHGAHCQLPALLFSKVFNRRKDKYGPQSLENRYRFAVNVLEAIRAEVGQKLAIEYRISAIDMVPGSPDIEEVIEFAKIIQGSIDLLHVSRGNLAINRLTPYIFPPTYMDHSINIELAAQFKRALKVPVSVVGAVSLDKAEEAIAAGQVDMIAMARQLIADPETVNKLERGQKEEIRPCIRCNTCISRSHFGMKPPRCAVNPVFGREVDYTCFPPPRRRKKVVVVGGGPAGLEAARTAAERGHDVVLFEKETHLGGVLWEASHVPFKADMRKYLVWSFRQTHSLHNIDIRLSTKATYGLIVKENADALILAIGSVPVSPGLTCLDRSRVVRAADVDSGDVRIGDDVLIAGAGLTGCEVALSMVRQGKQVALIDMLPRSEIGLGVSPVNTYALFSLLEDHGVSFRTRTRLVDVTDNHVIVEKDGQREHLVFDTIVLALGTKVDWNRIERLKAAVAECYVVGDSNGNQGSLWNATTSAFDAAMAL